MYVWDHKGISVTYVLLDPQREVAMLRVDRFPVLTARHAQDRRRWRAPTIPVAWRLSA
jgi:hypothetical protein